jgi:hypothetical protein
MLPSDAKIFVNQHFVGLPKKNHLPLIIGIILKKLPAPFLRKAKNEHTVLDSVSGQ